MSDEEDNRSSEHSIQGLIKTDLGIGSAHVELTGLDYPPTLSN